jgi:signal transduction histidine kinase/HPt (histidine-containing phosphotransfer) domain-containing protein
MPEMDGLETCRRLKADPRTADIPVIFVTARSEIEDEEAGFIAGAVDYIPKPISAPILLARVRTQIALRDAIVSATEADRAKSMFLATMSHEIRTPMNGIMSMAELLAGSAITAEQHEMVHLIRKSSESLLSIIEGILDFSKIEAGHLDIDYALFHLVDLFETVGDILRPRADEKGLTFLLDLDPTLPLCAMGDGMRLQQILLNLTGNAIKFTEAGSVVLRARRIGTGDDSFTLAVEVTDTGVGISAEQQARLFHPFVQADSGVARTYGGAGLGLAISQRLCTLLGGLIEIESRPGAGSCFHFEVMLEQIETPDDGMSSEVSDLKIACIGFASVERAALGTMLDFMEIDDVFWRDSLDDLPAVDAVLVSASHAALRYAGSRPLILIGRANAVRAAVWPVAGALEWPLRRSRLVALLAAVTGRAAEGTISVISPPDDTWAAAPRAEAAAAGAVILVADDDQTNRAVLRGFFGRWGYHADFARDGEEALTMFDPVVHGLLLIDIHMPRLDGIALARVIRDSTFIGAGVPIVALTADAMQATRQKALEAGMNGWLTKPIDSQALKAAVARWLPQAASMRRATGHANGTPPADLQAVDRAIFDWRQVMEPFGGWTGEARDFTQDFLRELPSKMHPLAEAMAAGDQARARFAAHALKGAARTAGAVRLGQVAADLQDCLDAGDMTMAKTFEMLLTITSAELEGALRPVLGGRP